MFEIKELQGAEDIKAVYPVVCGHYKGLTENDFMDFATEMLGVGYRLIAVFSEDEMAGVAGFRMGRRLYCGKYLHLDNMIVAENWRSKGVGRAIITWAKEEAARLGCDCLLADTYLQNDRAQQFFENNGFFKRGYHLKFDL